MKVCIVYSYSWPETEIEGVFLNKCFAEQFISEQEFSECYFMEEWEPNTYKVHIDNFHSEIVKIE